MTNFLIYDEAGNSYVDFNKILVQRFSERAGWTAIRFGDIWKLTAVYTDRGFRALPPGWYYKDKPVVVKVDISRMIHKDLVLLTESPICGCSDLIEFGDYVEAACKGVEIYELPYDHLDDYYDGKYLSSMHKAISEFVREIIQEGKNRLWNEHDPYGRMQPRIGWPGASVPWFKTNPDGTVMTDEHGGLISNGTLENLVNGLGQ